jgi:hypothetical protein
LARRQACGGEGAPTRPAPRSNDLGRHIQAGGEPAWPSIARHSTLPPRELSAIPRSVVVTLRERYIGYGSVV